MDGIFSPLDVDGGTGSDALSLIDFAGTADPLITLTSNSVTGMAPGDVTYAQIESLSVDVVDGGVANIAVKSTSAATQILLDSGHHETITFGNAGDMSGIQGTVF